MFKIIIADDEPVIIRGLKKMMNWERLNAEVIGEAANGEELLKKTEELKPDIIISDVAMPRKTGLDVIRQIRENGWKIKVIFLSGYQEFDYVKKAISYEAVDYLLKPGGQEELEQSILRAEKMLRTDSPMEYWEEEKDDMQTVFKKINSEYECRDLYSHFQEMGIETEGKQFVGVCFAISPELNRKVTDQNMRELLRFSIFKRIQDHLRENKCGFVIKREPNSSNVVLLMEKDCDEEWIKREIGRIRECIYGEYKTWLITGVGKCVEQAADLKYAYKTAKFSCELYYFCREEVVWYQEISREFCSSFEDYNSCYKELLDQILNRREEWTKTLSRILDIIENLHYGNRYAAENRSIAMAMDLFRDLQEYHVLTDGVREEYDRFTAKIRTQSTFRDLKKLVCIYLEKLIGENVCSGADSERESITLVKNYIQEHYAEDISLGSMAKMVYMNPYYFSTFFKKETGQNFKNYLVEVRMRQAMRLLMASDMKTYELAEAVGYHDVRTFTDKFREVFGDSPSAYKKRRKI